MTKVRTGLMIVGGALLVTVGFLAAQALSGRSLLGSETDSRNTQLMDSVTREQQVVLLSLGIQGISEKTARTTILGIEVPGSERALFLQYSFNAKLGIEGKDVRIRQTGENEYLVSVPGFVFIGHSNEEFKLAAENNGVLSWVTAEIDPVEMINSILDDEAKARYVSSNEEVLRDQAKAFYAGIVRGIDPTIAVRFEFRPAGG